MMEPALLFSVFGLDIYPYGICTAASVLCGCLLLVWLGRARLKTAFNGLRLALYAVPLCLLFARLGYCLIRAPFIAVDYLPGFWTRLDLGGYSLAGGFVGLLLAGGLFALVSKQPFVAVMDAAAPAALLTLAGLRLAEMFTLNGVGGYVDNEALGFFPLAVQNTYGESIVPVFFWEALTALILCIVLATQLRRSRTGNVALTGVLLIGLTQVFWESLRADDFLRFGFVRVNQLWGVLLAVFAIVCWLVRAHRRPSHTVLIVLAMVVCVGLLIAVEFGLDKLPIPNEALYGVMAAALTALGWMGLSQRNHSAKEATASARNESADRGDARRMPDHR